MRKEILVKTLILTILACIKTNVYADTHADMLFRTIVPKTVRLTGVPRLDMPRRYTFDFIDSENGYLYISLSARFSVNTNTTDENQTFILTSSVQTKSGSVSGYDAEGNLLFTNIDNLPSESDVEQARSHSGNNCNVIVYPVTTSTTSPFTWVYNSGHSTYGNCYQIDTNYAESGNIVQEVGSSPIVNTFHGTRDTAGTYEAVITLTKISE